MLDRPVALAKMQFDRGDIKVRQRAVGGANHYAIEAGAQELPKRSGQRRPIRHCEEPLRRSNPGPQHARRGRNAAPDCFASLAMMDRKLANLFLRVA